jgi:hypothetical protein
MLPQITYAEGFSPCIERYDCGVAEARREAAFYLQEACHLADPLSESESCGFLNFDHRGREMDDEEVRQAAVICVQMILNRAV